uniref:Uncharacterized protein n=1 Tax=Candidatus Berkiella aquae TaxID=295108 RepID=A0A0Q9YTH0_9GAMM
MRFLYIFFVCIYAFIMIFVYPLALGFSAPTTTINTTTILAWSILAIFPLAMIFGLYKASKIAFPKKNLHVTEKRSWLKFLFYVLLPFIVIVTPVLVLLIIMVLLQFSTASNL